MKSIPRLHIITDETLQSEYSHLELAELAVQGGADAVQFREKRLFSTRELIEKATTMVKICTSSQATLVVNDRVDVAIAAGARAVHLGEDDLPQTHARRVLGAGVMIGGTANSLQQALSVEKNKVDYLGVGPVFGTTSKSKRAPDLGLQKLKEICRQTQTPVIAIGNIQPSNVQDIIRAGAWGIAVLSGVVCQQDITMATNKYAHALAEALEE